MSPIILPDTSEGEDMDPSEAGTYRGRVVKPTLVSRRRRKSRRRSSSSNSPASRPRPSASPGTSSALRT